MDAYGDEDSVELRKLLIEVVSDDVQRLFRRLLTCVLGR